MTPIALGRYRAAGRRARVRHAVDQRRGARQALDEGAAAARATARKPLRLLTAMASYRKSLTRQGFSDSDIASLSDDLVNSLVSLGGPADVVERADRLREAGADDVHLTVLGEGTQPTGAAAARLLAAEFG